MKAIDDLVETDCLKQECFIFTFGSNHRHPGRCQVIFAMDYDSARECMFEHYGDKWCFQYTYREWMRMAKREDRMFPLETRLPTVYHYVPAGADIE